LRNSDAISPVGTSTTLYVFGVKAAAASDERAQQRSKREVKEGEDHAADPPSRRPCEFRHRYWHPSPSSAARFPAALAGIGTADAATDG
jgi:hypothetical protein